MLWGIRGGNWMSWGGKDGFMSFAGFFGGQLPEFTDYAMVVCQVNRLRHGSIRRFTDYAIG